MEEGRRTGVLVGLEGGRIWLPSHVVNVACKPVLMNISPKNTRNLLHRRPESSAGKRSSGEPGMHAVFIDSRPRSCGTGFFLPQCSRDYHMQRNKNPICSPVLLPSGVIQVLNLKKHVVHPPMTTIKEKEKDRRNYSSTTVTSAATKDRDDVEVLLPEEWSY